MTTLMRMGFIPRDVINPENAYWTKKNRPGVKKEVESMMGAEREEEAEWRGRSRQPLRVKKNGKVRPK